jgi:hypothetical protein
MALVGAERATDRREALVDILHRAQRVQGEKKQRHHAANAEVAVGDSASADHQDDQPRQHVSSANCALCDNGPILVGDLADGVTELDQVPEPVRRWLIDHGWRDHPRHGLICPDHALTLVCTPRPR